MEKRGNITNNTPTDSTPLKGKVVNLFDKIAEADEDLAGLDNIAEDHVLSRLMKESKLKE